MDKILIKQIYVDSQPNLIFFQTASFYQSPRRTSLVSNPHVSPLIKITMEKTTQTENKLPKWKQFLYCLKGDDKFRKQRQREAAALGI